MDLIILMMLSSALIFTAYACIDLAILKLTIRSFLNELKGIDIDARYEDDRIKTDYFTIAIGRIGFLRGYEIVCYGSIFFAFRKEEKRLILNKKRIREIINELYDQYLDFKIRNL